MKGHEGPHVGRSEHGVVEKALDRERERLDFHPGSASVIWGEFLCLTAAKDFLGILL